MTKIVLVVVLATFIRYTFCSGLRIDFDDLLQEFLSGDCTKSGELSSEEGELICKTTNGNSHFPYNSTFMWVITGRPGKIVRLHFHAFSLGTEEICEHDRLTVYDGSTYPLKQMRKLCGSKLPPDFYSNSESVTLTFRTAGFLADVRFRINYKVVDIESSGCGDARNLNSEEGIIQNNPTPRILYESGFQTSGQDCKWIISSRIGKTIHLVFKHFFILKTPECQHAYLIVRVEDNDIKQRLCGIDLPEDIYSNGATLKLWYKSLGKKSYEGFVVHYEILDREGSGCGGDRYFHEEYGVIEASELTNSRNHGVYFYCWWVITGRRGKIVQLTFDFLAFEKSPACTDEYLGVYDGANKSSRQIERLCGSATPAKIYSSGQSLLLISEYNRTNIDKRFRIRFKLVSVNRTSL